jgi:hypothetical protein
MVEYVGILLLPFSPLAGSHERELSELRARDGDNQRSVESKNSQLAVLRVRLQVPA